jgi:hypothetical protein
VTGRTKSLKNSSDSIGNRTRDLSACSAVPEPTAPPCILHMCHMPWDIKKKGSDIINIQVAGAGGV